MHLQTRVKPSEYHDSVKLMLVAKALLQAEDVRDAAVLMGTPANREFLYNAGLLTDPAATARPDDLVIVVKADNAAAAEAAMAEAERLLSERDRGAAGVTSSRRARSLASAIAQSPDANLVVISVSGRFAAQEARTALKAGLHVLLFSDNVPLADEIALKRLAVERGLLCMGPDAGTAIINGVALGFANAVPAGPVGLVGAAGTGLQAITCGLARAGAGVSQAIGTGGRDLSEAVGGSMMLAGLAALQADPVTQVIVLVSKPPAPGVAARILRQARHSHKPTVACFLGVVPAEIEATGAIPASTLSEAAALAAALSKGQSWQEGMHAHAGAVRTLLAETAVGSTPLAQTQTRLRGLFAGGTFCYETQLIWSGLADPVYSNAPTDPRLRLADSHRSSGHCCIDLGEDEFTQGRLHPMIDPTLRNRRILQEAQDPSVAVIMLDIVLGFGAHPDPAGATVPAIREAQALAQDAGRRLIFVAAVCGTEDDPQRLSRQESILRDAGVIVMPDNAAAARLAESIIQDGTRVGGGQRV